MILMCSTVTLERFRIIVTIVSIFAVGVLSQRDWVD